MCVPSTKDVCYNLTLSITFMAKIFYDRVAASTFVCPYKILIRKNLLKQTINISDFHYTKNKHIKHKPTQNSVGFSRLHFQITKSLLLLNPHRFRLLSLFLYLKMNLVPQSYSRCPPSSCPLVYILGRDIQYFIQNLQS
jgi:hypothetical protein